MTLALKVDGTTIMNLSKDYTVKFTQMRDVDEYPIVSLEQVEIMDMVITRKRLVISGRVRDGEDGKSISEWVQAFKDLTPSSFYVGSIEDSDGKYTFDNCKFANIEIYEDPQYPNMLFYTVNVIIGDVLS